MGCSSSKSIEVINNKTLYNSNKEEQLKKNQNEDFEKKEKELSIVCKKENSKDSSNIKLKNKNEYNLSKIENSMKLNDDTFPFKNRHIFSSHSLPSISIDKFSTKDILLENVSAIINRNSDEKIKSTNQINDTNTNSISIVFQANKFEAMYPLWIEQNKLIKFNVTGKYKLNDGLNENDAGKFDDAENKTQNEFYDGALIGRVLGGEYFLIYDELVYESNYSGPLFLKMYLNDFKCNPTGEFHIQILGAADMIFEKIEERIGWENELLDTGSKKFKINEIERAVLILVNKMRINPCLFAIQYLESIKNLTSITNRLYNVLTKCKPLPSVLLDPNLNHFARDLYSACNIPIIGFTPENINKRVEVYQNRNNRKIKVTVKKHKDILPLSILIKLILDENIRKNILDSKVNSLGIMVDKQNKLQSVYNTTLLVFGYEETSLEGVEEICI
jgi:hypothetical protein